ncbi:hypothetical protein [Chryseosolibacter indicus]|uniref:YhhN-like protein n=1 Tax=Chryseosolibacter indicus TaxID=2782351 RepID=A0ABS5VZB2_9BACT|nr:hypothetical protein [Chryseosolibacter indicus]MBT1706190.1 hypothetical protein [Chryseosolibacter indicus]
MQYLDIMVISSHALTITYFIAGLLHARNFFSQTPEYRWLAISLFFSVATEVAGDILLYFDVIPNYASIPYHLFCVVTFSGFFYHAINWAPLKKPIIIVNVVYILFTSVNYLFIQKIQSASYPQTIRSLVIIVFSITFFYKMLKELPTHQLQRDALFWIVSGVFFSYSGKLAIYSVTNYLITVQGDNMIIIWTFHHLLTIIGNTFIIYGGFLRLRKSNSYSS